MSWGPESRALSSGISKEQWVELKLEKVFLHFPTEFCHFWWFLRHCRSLKNHQIRQTFGGKWRKTMLNLCPAAFSGWFYVPEFSISGTWPITTTCSTHLLKIRYIHRIFQQTPAAPMTNLVRNKEKYSIYWHDKRGLELTF